MRDTIPCLTNKFSSRDGNARLHEQPGDPTEGREQDVHNQPFSPQVRGHNPLSRFSDHD